MSNQTATTLSQESLVKFANDIFSPLKNNECVSCMFVAGGGKRTIMKHLLVDRAILKKIFGNLLNKTLFVFVDSDEILNVSSEAYLRLILDNLILQMKENKVKTFFEISISNPLILIKKNLDNLISDGWRVIFLLHDFEFTLNLPASIYLNLENIMATDKSKVTYLFLSTINLLDESVLKNLHNLKYAVSRKVRYFSLFSESEADYLIDKTCEKIKLDLSHKVRKILYELCGGHPQLLKYSIYTLRDSEKENVTDAKKARAFLMGYYQLKIVCADIWNFLAQKEKDVVISVITTGDHLSTQGEEVEYLLKLGIIRKQEDKKYKVFGSLFEDFVKNKLPVRKMIYNANTKKLNFGIQTVEDKFTYQEFRLMVHFVTHQNELITRDQVAEAIWGKLYHDKYSDWSIDKIISTIRKKLDALGFSSENLVTLKKRGFSFSNP